MAQAANDELARAFLDSDRTREEGGVAVVHNERRFPFKAPLNR